MRKKKKIKTSLDEIGDFTISHSAKSPKKRVGN